MKGTFCGLRVLGPVVLAAVTAAAAPALARADVISGQQVPAAPAVAVPAAPAAPAAPATPALPAPPATPALPAPVAAATRAAVSPRAVGNGSVTVDPAAAEITIKVTPKTKAAVSPTKGSVSIDASRAVKPAHAATVKVVGKANRTAGKVKPVAHVAKKAGRVVANTSTDPLYGCHGAGWTLCFENPIESSPIDNRCYEYQTGTTSGTSDGSTNLPPFSPDFVTFTEGKSILWIKQTTKMVGLVPYTVLRMKQFVWGLNGTGSLDASTYRLGHDFQDTWEVSLPVGGDAVSKLTQDVLIVDAGTAPNMYYTEHFLVDPSGQITIKWHIVCHRGDQGDDMNGQDHDRSGNYDKYKHNHDDYHGYNDDDPGHWDQDD
jgi:hypothetical protein